MFHSHFRYVIVSSPALAFSSKRKFLLRTETYKAALCVLMAKLHAKTVPREFQMFLESLALVSHIRSFFRYSSFFFLLASLGSFNVQVCNRSLDGPFQQKSWGKIHAQCFKCGTNSKDFSFSRFLLALSREHRHKTLNNTRTHTELCAYVVSEMCGKELGGLRYYKVGNDRGICTRPCLVTCPHTAPTRSPDACARDTIALLLFFCLSVFLSFVFVAHSADRVRASQWRCQVERSACFRVW